ILAVVFTLYAALRPSQWGHRAREQQSDLYGLNSFHEDELIIGVTAIGTIATCLVDILLTSSGATNWGYIHALFISSGRYSFIHYIAIVIGVVHTTLIASFLRCLVFYYSDKEFAMALLDIRNQWFKSQHESAVSRQKMARHETKITEN
ncbi:MAG: hypothetical protein ACRDID_17300, partial [Ktedonobacterales bacterium]